MVRTLAGMRRGSALMWSCMQAYIVGRRFYRDVDISIGESLTFRAHADERGYQCTAALNADDSACPACFSFISPALCCCSHMHPELTA